MNKRVQEFLNQPFVLWFLSSVVIGLVTWQYSEMQKHSAEVTDEIRILKRAHLELNILLQDIRFGAESNENLTVGILAATLVKMQYNGLNASSQYYAPTLQNVILEIDSRTRSRGLDEFQGPIYKHLIYLTKIMGRVATNQTNSSEKIWGRLNKSEKQGMRELVILTQEIQKYYQAEANR
jgi:hypothetical protein